MPFAVGQARPLRWLVVAPFSAAPSGRVTAAAGERFATLMSRIGPKATVEIPDGLGDATTRTITLEFKRPRDFRLSEVIKRVDVLATLTEVADALARKPDIDTAVRKVRAAVGDGVLLQAMQSIREFEAAPAATPTPTPSPAAATAPAPSAQSADGSDSPLDAIFGKADIAAPAAPDTTAAAKSGLDAFIGAMRGTKGASKRTSTTTKTEAQAIAQVIRHAVNGTALDLLAAPAIASLEASWRGFRTVVSASPGADDLALDMLDADAHDLAARLEARLDAPPMERPDAVFVGVPVSGASLLEQLAQLGETYSVPIVTEVPPATSGAILDGQEPPQAPEQWAQLQGLPAAAWLCATSNAMVLANEEVDDDVHRIVFGSPVWGIAAMVSASVSQTGGPGQIFGRAGALVGPASYALDGDDAGRSIATERLASVEQQRTLADRGVLVIGSEQGSDRLRLAAAPTVHAGTDGLQLPGRILAGRAARFARAVRDDLPPHATDREVAARLAEASTNFLPRSPQGAVSLQIRTDEGGKLEVDASIGAALAGASFKFSSDL